MLCISGCVLATNTGQMPTVRGILLLKQKQLWSETGQQNIRTVRSLLHRTIVCLWLSLYWYTCCAVLVPLLSFRVGYIHSHYVAATICPLH